ncbi:MAG: two pore domain potassium channel family protein [Saprospiraceae bacterium]|nr:two pore domain potassium channel family protein [Saprospiraceae bacterium]
MVSTKELSKFQASFFFSVHTFTTVGYGNVYPIGFWANLVVILDAFSGLLMVAVATGLLFLRFSKAKVKINSVKICC